MAVAVLCCAAGAPDVEARLEEALAAHAGAGALHAKGRYSEALAQGERALVLLESVLGSAHPEVARCLDLLGVLYQLQGNAAGAESLLQRGLAVREAALGKSHPDVASSLDHLASLYKAQGAYDRAAPLFERALAIQEEALGKEHPQVARVLNNLARLYSEQGLYGRAEPLYQRAVAIQETALGKNHPDLASSLNNLASLYIHLGSYAQAELLATRALTLQQAAFGKNHPDIASSLDNLARVFARQGSFAKAEQAYLRALELVEQTQGRKHPYVAELLTHLARLRVADNRLGQALPALKRAFAISELRLRSEALHFSEGRLASFIAQLRAQEELFYELVRAAPHDDDVRHMGLTAALLRKGRSVEQMAETSRTAYQRASAQDREVFDRLRVLRGELASLSLQGPGPMPPADYQRRVKELVVQVDAFEAELARRSAPLRALRSLPASEDMVDRVVAALPEDSVLVEFVAYTDRSLLRKPGTLEPRHAPQLRYLALVLLPGGRIRAADLGPAAPIDSAAAAMRDALATRDVNFLHSAQVLYQRVLRPLWRFLDGTQQVFISPDGQLGLVPFAALHDGYRFRVEAHDFTYLTSGRDLLTRSRQAAPSQAVVVLADPDFDFAVQPSADKPLELAERSVAVERFYSTLRDGLSGTAWPSLPGTRGEAEAIRRMVPRARIFLGREATKARLLSVSAPGVLHLATHGFFLKDAATQEATRAVGYSGALSPDLHAASSADPLLRSGLLLAGASAPGPDASGATGPPPESTMVTALELVGLNLWGTQLVVLSACDTGRGDVKLGQGVYGLRRAFVAAGAETVVMSLWKVDDAVTRVLMESYYRNLLAGQGRATALHQAMLALRRTHPHPHYWAPFIVAGQNGPLRVATSPED
ncbi:CHAT domain-containing tetratricopeptide repeat protein [Pyxidicoccus xibeiensis]|uniref:CHAT domain-containing tetratricopeptide repeat protein n=1 Tax=Pyxidicoccus xibeiensis TaxID=2906759 RepID=UPI0020A7DB6A|nr:CHAT domain-containing tetratricopeptide repeat protein [Pyxidicoccus xibeiensis]MCP3140307.1 CHAT domain-containing protein [Pyxidicoccus xibeiensis]